MTNNNAIFIKIPRLLCLCFTIDLIAVLNVSAQRAVQTDSKNGTFCYSAKSKLNNFEPLLMEFPNTTRNDAQAKEYIEILSKTMKGKARSLDANLQMTGKSCARGLGHLYNV